MSEADFIWPLGPGMLWPLNSDIYILSEEDYESSFVLGVFSTFNRAREQVGVDVKWDDVEDMSLDFWTGYQPPSEWKAKDYRVGSMGDRCFSIHKHTIDKPID